jgi:hypothetical protein
MIRIPRASRRWNADLGKLEDVDQKEKFLFYRGIGNFTTPLHATFNSEHNLVVRNAGVDPLSYVLVYERKENSEVIIHWSGSLNGGTRKTVVMLSQSGRDPVKEQSRFINALVRAGLYEDEAKAMLATWEKSYFRHPGLKVFWIVPRAFTDSILPLKMDRIPDNLERVLVGRTEVLTPEFEQRIGAKKDTAGLRSEFANDRFILAYEELFTRGILIAWTDYNELTEDEAIDKPEDEIILTDSTERVRVYPTPTRGELIVELFNHSQTRAELTVYNSAGTVVFRGVAMPGIQALDLESYAAGLYIVKIDLSDGEVRTFKVVRNDW